MRFVLVRGSVWNFQSIVRWGDRPLVASTSEIVESGVRFSHDQRRLHSRHRRQGRPRSGVCGRAGLCSGITTPDEVLSSIETGRRQAFHPRPAMKHGPSVGLTRQDRGVESLTGGGHEQVG